MEDNPIPAALASELLALLQQGKKIEAIRVYREAEGCGLKEAKEAVERFAAGVERERPGLLPKASGCAAGALALLAVALAAAWLAA